MKNQITELKGELKGITKIVAEIQDKLIGEKTQINEQVTGDKTEINQDNEKIEGMINEVKKDIDAA